MSSKKCITLEEELKKNPELKLSDIQILREWCEKQPHLPKIQDVEFAIFLHSNYYRIEPAKNTIENYYTYRSHAPELFSNRDVMKEKRLRDAFNVVAQVHLEGKTKEGYSILFARIVDMNPSHFFHNEVISAGLIVYEEYLWTRGSMKGIIWVADATGFTTGHVGRLNLQSIKKIMYYIQDALPIRLKALHIINTSPIVEMAYNMIKPFISAELIHLVHFHSSVQSLSEYIPIEVLPNECGGKAGLIRELMDANYKRIENFREWFLEDEKINRVNESLRIGKIKTSGDLFGVDGSFKQIEID